MHLQAVHGVPAVAQQFKDLVLSLEQHGFESQPDSVG